MKNNHILSYSIALALVVLLILLSPLTPWMPPMGGMAVLLVVTVLLAAFAGFVMYEEGGDERAVVHQMNAGRIAYLSGIGILTLALIVQGFAHRIDPWILVAIGVMVLAKVTAHFYSEKYQ